MKTIISGSHDLTNYNLISELMEHVPWDITEVVSGACRGVDKLGERWANDHLNKEPKLFPAKWKKPDGTTDRSAGYRRNVEMSKYSDALVAVWDGKSPGTNNMINIAIKKEMPILVFSNSFDNLTIPNNATIKNIDSIISKVLYINSKPNIEWTDLNFFHEKIDDVLDTINQSNSQILPVQDDWFKALDITSFKNTKVVILGRDPYPSNNPIYANGLAFSVNKGIYPLPKSLQIIFKELKNDLGINRVDGDLTDWAKQGVLLLNTSLTVEAGKPQSHKDIGWMDLINEIITTLSENKEHLVFVLWGNNAKSKKHLINMYKHYVIQSTHPSPLSAERGFFKSRPFSRINEYLINHNMDPINW